MLSDPQFYLLSVPAVLLYGVAKGGFGGAVAILAVPLMSLMMSPAQAAAILLPILVVMDMVVIYSYRGHYDARALRLLLPAGLLGVGLGFLFAHRTDEALLRLLVGTVALAFGLQFLLGRLQLVGRQHRRSIATLFGTLSGFTSFSIHAGGPPLSMYLLPKGLAPVVYAGTAGLFFTVINLVKLPAYGMLGQFSLDNLRYSLALVPFAPIGVLIGRRLVGLSNPGFYYRLIALFLALVGAKLIFDGLQSTAYAQSDPPSPVTLPAGAGYTAPPTTPDNKEPSGFMSESFSHVKIGDTVAVAPQLQPQDLAAVAAAGFRVVINNRPDGEALEQPTSQQMRDAAAAAGLEYHYYPLNGFNFPGDDLGAMRALFERSEQPVLAFCRSGTRSANLWISTREAPQRDKARAHVQGLGFDVSMSLR